MSETQLEAGQVVDGRYRVVEVLGRGGFALVYGAERLDDGAQVVIKSLHQLAIKHDTTAYDRFKREAAVAASLEHPNIVRTTDFGKLENGQLFLVMERIDGRPLDQVLKQGPQPPERVGRIIAQLLDALSLAHAHTVIHRDLKPTNILICGEGEHEVIKVIDFGLAKVLEGTDPNVMETLTALGQIVGTPGYLAPEVLHGGKVTTQADIYAAGIIGHELLVGHIAYTGGSLDRVHAQAAENPAPPPAPLGSHPVYRVLLGLMARDPAARYAEAGQAAADLRRALAGGRRPWWKFW